MADNTPFLVYYPVGIIAKKSSLKECFLLIRQYTPTDCFFGDFAHWVLA